jgi:hypothetical protein
MSKPVRRRAPAPEAATTAPPPVLRSLVSYVKEQTVRRIRDYLGRGRPLAGVPLESLRALWIHAWLDVGVMEDENRADALRDLDTEFDLRGLEPPKERVVPEGERFRQHLLAELRKRTRGPDFIERLERDFEALCDRLILEDREALRP